MSKHFGDMESDLWNEIKEMEYEFKSVLLSTVPYYDNDTTIKFALDRLGHRNLRCEFSTVLESEYPHVLIFGTCFSKKSEVNDFICAYGLYPALFLSADLGNVTDGKCYRLDDQQNKIIKAVLKVRINQFNHSVMVFRIKLLY